MTRLCLNMILKNEAKIIARCLQSVAPFISSYAILDTGSTDGTQGMVRDILGSHGIDGVIYDGEFHNFGQARNAALGLARMRGDPSADYLLLCDADMELVVTGLGVFDVLSDAAYIITQRANGGFAYGNTRLLKRDVAAEYKGVTHEFLSVAGPVGKLPAEAVHFLDHADGSNRPDKFERDIRLLTEAIDKDPGDLRSVFYLAQSYRDLGKPQHAAGLYRRRAEAGGWEEERWRARLEEARCYRAVPGYEEKFVATALQAFEMRPSRAEPIHDLAKHYREKGQSNLALLFAEKGMAIPYPSDDRLFIEEWVYRGGFVEEIAISGFYVPGRRALAHKACETLAMHRGVSEAQRAQGRRNLQFYAHHLVDHCPSFSAAQVPGPPHGMRYMNPSVARFGGGLVVNIRAVNYTVRPNGSYVMPEGQPIVTRNFLARVDEDDLVAELRFEIAPPFDLPDPSYPLVKGCEDVRLFTCSNKLMCVSNIRELTPEGWCQQMIARIDLGNEEMADWKVMRPEGKRHEKNWMPLIGLDRPGFIYGCDPTVIVDDSGTITYTADTDVAVDNFRGGSQAVPFDGGWLAVVHEVDAMPGEGERSYQHRFAWWDAGFALRKTSPRFFFNARGIEFCAGLAWHPDEERLVVSYGAARDSEAWIGSVNSAEVRAMLADHSRITGAQ